MPARLRFKACWLSCCTVNHGARHAGHLMAGYVPLSSRTRSNGHSFNRRAERHLAEVSSAGAPAGFSLELPFSRYILSVRHWPDDWAAIALFYNSWSAYRPRSATRVGYAARSCGSGGPEAGLAVLESIDRDAVADYQPYWRCAPTSAKIGKTGQASEATTARSARGKTPVREFLLQKRG